MNQEVNSAGLFYEGESPNPRIKARRLRDTPELGPHLRWLEMTSLVAMISGLIAHVLDSSVALQLKAEAN
ncbi:hypothetical protein V6N13_023346 [Hibiscus sabdariffa]|uniref:Uncharacterized protein n=2 Tax=Hibiscus sabdariffa TaxID=183260 RepID=A0ABR2PLJ2_9ROSI